MQVIPQEAVSSLGSSLDHSHHLLHVIHENTHIDCAYFNFQIKQRLAASPRLVSFFLGLSCACGRLLPFFWVWGFALLPNHHIGSFCESEDCTLSSVCMMFQSLQDYLNHSTLLGQRKVRASDLSGLAAFSSTYTSSTITLDLFTNRAVLVFLSADLRTAVWLLRSSTSSNNLQVNYGCRSTTAKGMGGMTQHLCLKSPQQETEITRYVTSYFLGSARSRHESCA